MPEEIVEQVMTLGPDEVVRDRPFTHPRHIQGDVNTLRHMVDQLALFLEQYGGDKPEHPVLAHRPDRRSWAYRLLIARPGPLSGPGPLSIVGFLGQRLAEADVAAANEFDKILLEEIPEYPGLLSYSTMALVSGNYSNLVVFSDPRVKEQWSQSKAHAQAVRKLAPDYYSSVSLYNGLLPRGIHNSNALRLTRIKYFDYQSEPRWRAVRVFGEEA
jgi:hypothetical protein